MKSDIRETARRLARTNVEYEPNIEAVFLFPSEEEIRLVEVDSSALPSESDSIVPYYFAPDPEGDIQFPVAVALIRPEEKKLKPPEEWGDWDEAELIWPAA